MSNKEIQKLLDRLSPEEQKEVIDFVEFLLTKKQTETTKQNRLQLSWAGGLKAYKDKYTSVELQKKALDWMGS